jgi:hypothetical protein
MVLDFGFLYHHLNKFIYVGLSAVKFHCLTLNATSVVLTSKVIVNVIIELFNTITYSLCFISPMFHLDALLAQTRRV